jgi:putative ABC transport system permease protein
MPDWKKEIGERLAGLKLEAAREAEIIEELSQHLEDRYQELVIEGATSTDASRIALAELSDGPMLALELSRIERSVRREPAIWGAKGGRFPSFNFISDFRYALRSLGRARWFAIAAALTFAFGIGVNVAVFSAVDRVLFRALPYDHPDQIFQLGEYGPGRDRPYGTLPASYVVGSRHLSGVVDGSVAGFPNLFSMSREPGNEARILLTSVSYNTLAVFGVRPLIGRDFTEQDARAKNAAALISYDLWRGKFNGAQDIIGRKVWSNDEPTEIIGVLPPEFIPASSFLYPSSAGLVLDFDRLESAPPGSREPPPYLRLKTGVSSTAVQAEIDAFVERWKQAEPPPRPGSPKTAVRLLPLKTVLFGAYASYLWLIVAAGALVLVIACANLASLLLVRGRSREHQAAVRVALGASAARLMRTAVVESLVLSFAGTLIGLLALAWAGRGLEALLPPLFSRYSAPAYDLRVIGFSILTATLSALLAGVLPCLRLAKVDVLPLLQQGGGRSRTARLRGGRSLLVVEAAVSVVLVAGAMMTARSLIGLVSTDVGFKPEALYSVRVVLPPVRDAQTSYQQYMQVLEVVRDLHGVNQASAADVSPISGFVGMDRLGPGFDSGFRWQVTNGFFETMGMRLIAGRTFSSADLVQPGNVGILSQMGLHLVWPGIQPSEAVGRMLEFPGEAPRQVIGVVSDVRSSYSRVPSPSLYLPISPERFRFLMFVARSQTGAALSLSELRNRVRERIATPTFVSIGYVPDLFSSGLLDQKFRTMLFSTFGIVALLLAAVGLYAVGSFEVAMRRSEMGVRMSLGATAGNLQRLVIRDALTPVVVGILVGLIVTYWGAKFLQSFLYQVDARDPVTYVLVALVLIATAIVAAWLPARRAARTDPATVLRAE